MSVSDIDLFKQRFGTLVVETYAYDDLATALRRDDLAAVIVEPIVQAAAGMRILPTDLYAPLRGPRTPLLIVDEIATGFGRTGTLFAYEQLALQPDILALGKGLTGGTPRSRPRWRPIACMQRFSGIIRRRGIFSAVIRMRRIRLPAPRRSSSLELFETEHTLEHVAHLDAALDALLVPLRNHALVVDVRRAGLMFGIEIDGAHIYTRGAITPA